MILFAHFIRENGRLKCELRDLRASYESMTAAYYEARGELDLYADKPNYRQALIQLDAAVTERAALRARLEEVEHHIECMSIDNAELEKSNAALVDSHLRRWWETGAK